MEALMVARNGIGTNYVPTIPMFVAYRKCHLVWRRRRRRRN
jgi:hypothetical protein